ncbi:MAG: Bug family tripartite tricarboxylate transporter substrate binding protein [Xanthobacteraceae bacterium]
MRLFARACLPAILALSCIAGVAPGWAQPYPTRLVRVIMPFGAGGPTDVFTRQVADELSKSLQQPFVMENRPGAGSIIGSDAAAKSPPDGYTLLMISATQTTTETLVPNKPFKLMRDFVPVASIMSSELVMVVHPSLGVKTVQEFVALAKAKPGTLNYASSGIGSNYHMAGELFKILTGTDIVHIPYKGSTGARNDIISGQVQMMFDSIPTMAQMIETGRVIALGTTGKVRSPGLPDVPTLTELGIPHQASIWLGIMAPAGTPRPVVDLLNNEINRIVSRPEIKGAWEKLGAVPVAMSSAEFGTFVQSEIERWARVIKTNDIKPE